MIKKVEFPEIWDTLQEIEDSLPSLDGKEPLEEAIAKLATVYNGFMQHVDVKTNMGAFLYTKDWHSAVRSDLVRKYKSLIERDEEND